MIDPIPPRLTLSPTPFPHFLDAPSDSLLLLHITEEQLAAASFLDRRIVTPQSRREWISFAEVAAQLDSAGRDDAHYIFHIGHVGSTLVSRLLGCLVEVLALREPQVLRNAADLWTGRDQLDACYSLASLVDRLQVIRRLLARTFRPEQRAMIKATSFASDIAPLMVTADARALFLTVKPQSYMTTILAGEASRQELRGLTGARLTRLARHLGPMPFRFWQLGEGERVALGWAGEMLSLSAAEAALPAGSVLWVDFDDFLARPARLLIAISAHFGFTLSEQRAAQILSSPIMRTYSKAPEHRYDTALRRTLQAQAAIEHAPALRAGMQWLETLASDYPQVARLRGLRSA